ncbi:unnamed protein product [Cyclocybe aegerita]|uniref:Uncharacterized protein n=1 Tax=Cyclocybe aegerita TaxID=1973307 RepID=A0A8S0XTB1_CYCAE|nr:unnamed protein product [Cyclocybe aegerita]
MQDSATRFRGVGQEHHRQADEDYSPGWLLRPRARRVSAYRIQERPGISSASRDLHEEDRARVRGVLKSGPSGEGPRIPTRHAQHLLPHGHRRGHPPALEGPRHPKNHGRALIRLLPHGFSRILLRRGPKDRRARIPAQRDGRPKSTVEDGRDKGDEVYHGPALNTHVRRWRAAVRAEKMDPLFRERHIDHILYGAERIRPGTAGGENSESDGGVAAAIRVRHQLKMVPPNINYLVLEQDRRIQEQATEGASGAVFPRIHGRVRYQQSGEIHSVEVHAGEQGEAERISASNTSDRYHEYPTSIRRRQGDDSTKCTQRLGDSIVTTLPLCPPLFCSSSRLALHAILHLFLLGLWFASFIDSPSTSSYQLSISYVLIVIVIVIAVLVRSFLASTYPSLYPYSFSSTRLRPTFLLHLPLRYHHLATSSTPFNVVVGHHITSYPTSTLSHLHLFTSAPTQPSALFLRILRFRSAGWLRGCWT